MVALCVELILLIALPRPADNDSVPKAHEEIAMKLVIFTSGSSSDAIAAILGQGNLAMEWVPESYGDFKEYDRRRIIGSEEQIRTLKLVSGWQYDYAECKRLGDHALLAHLDDERLIAIVKQAFPGIQVETFDYTQWDDEHPERTPEEIDDEFDRWLHSR